MFAVTFSSVIDSFAFQFLVFFAFEMIDVDSVLLSEFLFKILPPFWQWGLNINADGIYG